MLVVTYAECRLCRVLLLLSVVHAHCNLCRVLLMLSVILLRVVAPCCYENGATTLKITTLSIKSLFVTLNINDTQLNQAPNILSVAFY